MNNTTLVIDASGFVWRSFYKLEMRTSPAGLPINAVEGLIGLVLKPILENTRCNEVAVVFDHPARTFRNDILATYKANRPPPPDDFVAQRDLFRQATRAFGLPLFDVPGVEADDVIATIARQAVERGREVIVSSSDKDLMQLVSSKVRIYDQQKKAIFREVDVFARFGVAPSYVPDLQALTGDAIDGVPGVPGIGPKTAARLVSEHGDLEDILSVVASIKPDRISRLLSEHAEEARIAKRLVKLKDDVDLGSFDLSFRGGDSDGAAAFVSELGLPSYLVPRAA